MLWAASGENPDSPRSEKSSSSIPKYIPAYISLGNAYFYKKRSYGQASEYFRKAAEIAPSAQIHNLFGTVLRTQGNYNAAIDEYQKAIQLNPKYAPAYMNLGITYFYMNQLNQSIARQKEAITLNPNYPDSYFFIAQGYDRENNAQQAIMYYRKFLEMSLEQGQYAGYAATARERLRSPWRRRSVKTDIKSRAPERLLVPAPLLFPASPATRGFRWGTKRKSLTG